MIPSFDPTPEIEQHWDEINKSIQKVLRHGKFILGPEVQQLEEKVADYIGGKHAIGVNSGTDALVIGMRAAGIEPGDEVITTPFSFFATAESISMIGAKPIFIDVCEKTFNLDPANIEQAITNKTKAVLPVHLFGKSAEMSKIMEVAEEYDLKVIEDCAQSFGAEFHGKGSEVKKAGSIGDVGAFSFFPTKNLGGIGDGGMITTDNDDIAEMARILRKHGARKKYHNEILGYNSRLDTLQAAILLVKLKYIDEFNNKRRNIAKAYTSALENIEGLVVPEVKRGDVFHQYTVRIKNGRRDEMKQKLKQKGISTPIYYPIPQDKLPVYKGKYLNFPVSEQLSEEVLSLPMWPDMGMKKVKRVVKALEESLK